MSWPAALALATDGAQEPVATLTLQYQQSERKWFNNSKPLFGAYLGTGSGVGTGALQGTVGWDLYEDQSRKDLHPAFFRGFVTQGTERHSFQIVGVFTPVDIDLENKWGSHRGASHARQWTLSGTIVFDDNTLLGVRHAPLTGSVNLEVMTGKYTVWRKQ